MRPRYEARVATMRHRQQGHRPWVLVRVTHGTDDGVPVEFARVVASYGDRDDAIAEAEHRNDMQEGLHQIGVAVAVWAGMAWGKAEGRKWPRGTTWSDGYRHAASTLAAQVDALEASRRLLDFERAEMAAERAARRKWELRLRWRAKHRREGNRYPHYCSQGDLLQWRAVVSKQTGRLFLPSRWRVEGLGYESSPHRRPIAGPRGVLP